MKKGILLGSMVAAVTAVAFAVAPNSGAELMRKFTGALNGAESLRVEYTIQSIGGAPDSYTVTFAKPNRARIDGPAQLIVADGKTITTFDKKAKTYFKKAQNETELRKVLSRPETNIWSSFFFGDTMKVDNARAEANKTRKGVDFRVVRLTTDTQAGTSALFYLHPEDGVARQVEFVTGNNTRLLDTRALELGRPADANLFAFNAPQGSREVKESEMVGFKWVYNLDEGMKIAKETNRMVMVDFFATWCGPCKMLDRDVFSSERFQAMSKHFVFVKIDGDQNPGLVREFGVEGYPTIKFMTNDGKVVHEMVGYRPLNDFMAEMEKVVRG